MPAPYEEDSGAEYKTKDDLRAILPWEEEAKEKADICEWIEELTEHEFENKDEWIRECDDGVVLCRLLMALDHECSLKYARNTKRFWSKRDNMHLFISALRERIEENAIFDISDILESENTNTLNDAKVILGLASLAFWAYDEFKTKLPDTLRERQATRERMLTEQDINEAFLQVDGLEPPHEPMPLDPPDAPEEPTLPRPPDSMGLTLREVKEAYLRKKYQPVEDDEIDCAVDAALREQEEAALTPLDIQLVRLKKGQYLLLPAKRLLYMTTQSGRLMVRVGGGWTGFDVWYERQARRVSDYRPPAPTTIQSTAYDREVSDLAAMQECLARSTSRTYSPPRARSPGRASRASRASTPPTRRGTSSSRHASPSNSGLHLPPRAKSPSVSMRHKSVSGSHCPPVRNKSPSGSYHPPVRTKSPSGSYQPPVRHKSPAGGIRGFSPSQSFAPSEFGVGVSSRHSSRQHTAPRRTKSPSSSRPNTTSPAARMHSRRSVESFSSRSPRWAYNSSPSPPPPPDTRGPFSPVPLSAASLEQQTLRNSPSVFAGTGGVASRVDPYSDDERLDSAPMIVPKSTGIRDYTIRRGRRRGNVEYERRRLADEEFAAVTTLKNESKKEVRELPEYRSERRFDLGSSQVLTHTSSINAKKREKFSPSTPRTASFIAGAKFRHNDSKLYESTNDINSSPSFSRSSTRQGTSGTAPAPKSPGTGYVSPRTVPDSVTSPLNPITGMSGTFSKRGANSMKSTVTNGLADTSKGTPASEGDDDQPQLQSTRMRLAQLLGTPPDSPETSPKNSPGTPAAEPACPDSPARASEYSEDFVDA